MSCKYNYPVPYINGANAKLLPPDPAQKSNTF